MCSDLGPFNVSFEHFYFCCHILHTRATDKLIHFSQRYKDSYSNENYCNLFVTVLRKGFTPNATIHKNRLTFSSILGIFEFILTFFDWKVCAFCNRVWFPGNCVVTTCFFFFDCGSFQRKYGETYVKKNELRTKRGLLPNFLDVKAKENTVKILIWMEPWDGSQR